MDKCWICEGPTATFAKTMGDSFAVSCRCCGPYTITRSLAASKFSIPEQQRFRVSYWCRQRLLDGRSAPALDTHSIAAVAAGLPDFHQAKKADVLLLSLGKRYPKPGEIVDIDWHCDYPLACAADGDELAFHFNALVKRGFVIGAKPLITFQGWDRIESLSRVPEVSKTAFVAMHFSAKMLAMWKVGFGEAITKAGFEPILANYPDHNEQIDAKIVAEIKQARFVVADVTGARTGVYFEAGFALGSGRPVIWTCNHDHQTDMHFDTRQYNHILWSTPENLSDQLYYRIVATI